MIVQAEAKVGPRSSLANAPMAIEVVGLTRRYGDFTALDQVDLAIREGEFFSLLGPSGCGKTTLLRILGGLDQADAGVVRIAGQDAGELSAHRRPVNTVFQSYALFPHLTVRENVAFGLRMKKVREPALSRRVEEALAMVQIGGGLAGRKPAQLSGGQKQRVALARALVNEPRVLLLDEPLGALDLQLRKELQVELLALQRRLGITFLFVTHDQEEALVLSDRIAVMRAGKIEQLDEGHALYERPRNRFVGQFLGSCNLIEGTVTHVTPEELVLASAAGTLRALRRSGAPAAGKLTLAIRPEKVRLLPAARSGEGENRCECVVEHVIYTGSASRYLLRRDGQPLTAEVMNAAPGMGAFQVGQSVAVELPPASLIVLED